MPADISSFPHDFLWGAATAAHQIEGNNTNSDWWWSESMGRLPHRSGDACDSWNRWSEDVRLLSETGLNAYRLSVEWARIEPRPGTFDQSALDHYRRQLEALRQAGIEPLVTLHHFTSPRWLAERGGWRHPDSIARFTVYAAHVSRALGDLVTWWITVNEPSILSLKAYLEGSWPPHRRGDVLGFVRVLRHIVRGHAAARMALHADRREARVSLSFAIWPLEPLRPWSPLDQLLVRLADWFWQARVLHESLPNLDWIGVNYYTRVFMGWPPRLHGDLAAAEPHAGAGDRTDYGWEIYPEGLYGVLKRVGRFGLPVVITENGISDADDDRRPAYIVAHLRQAYRAIQAGVNLRGYMHWSLLDNFEWADGYEQHFGLYTRDRQSRPSASLYGQIARANAVLSAEC
jgi:beta-glucosidase